MNILIITLLLAGIFVYFLLQPQRRFEGRMYKVAAAGEASHASNLVRVLNNLSNKNFVFNGEIIDASNYEIFIVNGESLANCDIHTGNGLLVDRYIDKSRISTGMVVVYEVNKQRYVKEHPEMGNNCGEFKIRQLLGYVQIENNNNDICKELIEKDPDLSQETYQKVLFDKLDRARCYGINNQIVTISITYKDGYKDYSVHTLSELYGVVMYIIPKDQITT